MRTILSVTMLITGLLAPISAEGPVRIFTSQPAPCVLERSEQPRDEPVRELASASSGAQEPT